MRGPPSGLSCPRAGFCLLQKRSPPTACKQPARGSSRQYERSYRRPLLPPVVNRTECYTTIGAVESPAFHDTVLKISRATHPRLSAIDNCMFGVAHPKVADRIFSVVHLRV